MVDLEKNDGFLSKISDHKQQGKKLTPPLAQIPFTSSPWLHDRMPEMLWAVLAVGNLPRDKALEFFRHVAKYVNQNKDAYDVTSTSIGKLPKEQANSFITHMLSWSPEIAEILRPLCLYPELPNLDVWKELLKEPVPEEDWEKVRVAVRKTLDHQSQESTDCRWIKVMCYVVGGKLQLESKEAVEAILRYPNQGDQQVVRPTIRATEIALQISDPTEWSKHFWDYSYLSTDCVPDDVSERKVKARKEEWLSEDKNRDHFKEQTTKVRCALTDHFFAQHGTMINARREVSFGLALYGLTLFTEIIFYRSSKSISGRIALRSLVENYINFKYLLEKEKTETKIWDDFHLYGNGKIKLIYMKLKENNVRMNSVNMDDLRFIANEDAWTEFVPINLGHWDSTDMRKMSDAAGVKDIYDKFYDYTSGFVHGNRGAVRESIYQVCFNELHRLHRIPAFDMPLMASVTLDSVEIVNKLLDCLDVAYPPFEARIELPS